MVDESNTGNTSPEPRCCVPTSASVLTLKEILAAGMRVRVGEVEVNVVDMGQGPAVVMIHGFSSSIYTWRMNISYLAQQFRVIAIDLPGFGLSASPPQFQYGLKGYSDLLHELVEKLDLGRVSLVGHSYGGAVSLTFAREYPKLVRKLVLISATDPLGGFEEVAPKVCENLLLFSYYDSSHITDEVFEAFRTFNASKRSKEVQQILSLDLAKSKTDSIEALDVSCLILWGERDRILPQEQSINIKRYFLAPVMHTFPKCGHTVHEEQAVAANKLLAQFLLGDRT